MRKFTVFTLLAMATSTVDAGSLGPLIDDSYGQSGLAHVGFDIGGDKVDTAQASVLLADGSLIVGGVVAVQAGNGGAPETRQVVLTKLTPAGAPDMNFGTNGRKTLSIIPAGGQGELQDIAITSGGEIALVARYTTDAFFNPPFIFAFALLKSDGTPDSSFNLSGYRTIAATAFNAGANSTTASRVIPVAGGKLVGIVGVGSPTQYCVGVIRLGSDGSTDPTFAGGAGTACYSSNATPPIFEPQDALLLGSGDILVTGLANHGVDANNGDIAVMRLLAGGTVDTGFGTSGWTYVAYDQGGSQLDQGDAIAVDSQGRIIVAGYFQGPQSQDIAVVRLSGNGILDSSFGTGGRVAVAFDVGQDNDDRANSVIVLPGDSLLVGGFAHFFGTGDSGYRAAAVELNAGGSVRAAFGSSGEYVQGGINATAYQKLESPAPFRKFADYLLMPGTTYKADDSDSDFGVARVVLPLFVSGFETD
ncbi:MAG TPA: delta-60 repeat domain-containing protein [Rudaea sp.]|nr:delta-60 repeat domain-containing protein [Rudaea sp.]HSC12465.1 delta-60 repeat domain-containing protein [Rhodanobacteraceae bacterium]